MPPRDAARFQITQRTLLRLGWGVGIGLVAGGVMVWAYLSGGGNPVTTLALQAELVTVDWRHEAFRDHSAQSQDITIVVIDELSLQRGREMFGHAWPWPRVMYAYLVDRLSEGGARVVAFDMALSADRIEGRATGQESVRIDELSPPEEDGDDPFGPDPDAEGDEDDEDYFGPDPDAETDFADADRLYNAKFAEAARNYGKVIVGLTMDEAKGADEDRLAEYIADVYRGGAKEDLENRLCLKPAFAPALKARPNARPLVRAPYPVLREQIAAAGLVDRSPDIDSKERRVWFYTPIGDEFVCADFATAIWLVAQDASPSLGDGYYDFAGKRIALRRDGSAWIRWAGRSSKRFNVINSESLLRATFALEEGDEETPYWIGSYTEENVRDRLVIIGAAGEAQGDIIASPFGNLSGVFKQAAVLDMLLTGSDLHDISPLLGLLLIMGLTLSVTVGICLVFPTGSTMVRTGIVLAALTVLTGYVGISFAAFERGVMFPLFYVGWALISGGFWALVYAFFFAARDRRQLETKMRSYVSDKVMNRFLEAYERGDASNLQPERVRITVLFSDIAGFTGISERLGAEDLVELLNEYLGRMTTILRNDYDAYVDKYVGDAIMAVWGAPYPQPNQCELAVRGALDNAQATDDFADELESRGLSRISARIGLNTGFAVVGETGSTDRYQYTALGDTVNIGARLEGINKYYGTRIMMGAETYEGAQEIVIAREVDFVQLKGKKIAVPMYEPLSATDGEKADWARGLAARYQEPYELYKGGQFEEAARLFKQLLVDYPADGPTQVMLNRIETFHREGAPTDWTGAWEMTEK